MSNRFNSRQFTTTDKWVIQMDRALRTLAANYPPTRRQNPAQGLSEPELTEQERCHAAGLMRINHVGEVCAQALYQGQALTAHRPEIQEKLEQASQEEFEHLHWCLTRLHELHSRPSYLNGFWYLGALIMGVMAGMVGDQWSLGFVAETEKQVESHLDMHLRKLPSADNKSRAILLQMQLDEKAHAAMALAEGGIELPPPIRVAMTGLAGIMKIVAYRI